MSPPLWFPAGDPMLSSSTTSLLRGMVSPFIVNRLTRLAHPPGAEAL